MEYKQLIDAMTPEVYQNLKQSIETGKWPDGKPLSPAQREHAMAAVIAWGQAHLAEHERVGYINKGHKADETCDDPEETPLAWKTEFDK